MTGVEVAGALAAVKLVVGGVYSELAKPWWQNDKNVQVLRRLLPWMESVISGMNAPLASPEQLTWLKEVQPSLEGIRDALTKHEESGFFGEFWTSRGVMKKLKQLRELCQSEVPVLTLHNAMHNADDMHKELESIKQVLTSMEERMEAMRLDNPRESQQALGIGTSHRHQDTDMTFGVEHDIIVEKAVQKLLESNGGDECVGLWGLGGSGKTLAAQRVFNDSKIQAHFKGGCYWLTVGNSKTNIPKLMRELAQILRLSFTAIQCGDDDIMNELAEKLKGQERMFIVLDDVWNTKTLKILDVIPKGVQCKVLITTRKEDVLKSKHAARLKMPTLSGEDSWKLFCHRAWRGVANIPLELEEVGRQIASECDGLPLALIVIGGYLAHDNDLPRWKRTLEKLKNAHLVSPDQEEQLYSKLQLSVDELDNDKIHEGLKDCFFSFAAFPEDFEVELKRDLLPMWLGDGIVGNKSKYDAMEEVEELVGELVRRSLIEMRVKDLYKLHLEDFYKFEKKVYVVHDVLRDLIRYMVEKVPLARRDCWYEAGVDLNHLPDDFCNASGHSQVKMSVMSVMSSNVKELPEKFVNAPRLKVMILQENPIEVIPGSFFCGNFREMRVLDLSKTHISSLPESLKTLKHLVVLNLSYSMIEKISSSFFKAVTNLVVLNVRGCWALKQLHCSISLLSNLQYFNAALCLKVHDIWKMGEYYQWRRGSLGNLMKLASLKELHIESKYQKALPGGFFEALKHLRVLMLRFESLVSIPEPKENELEHLQWLDLGGCWSLTSLPNSFGVVVKNLHTLNLHGCWSLGSLPKGLAGLPKLEYLNLVRCRGLECFPVSFSNPGAFPVLRTVDLSRPSSKVVFPELQAGAMPQLEHLDLYGWEQLVDFPKAISNLTKLRSLDLGNCSNLRSLEHEGVGIQSLANLEELLLRGCRGLSTLPDGLEELPKLRRIDISYTNITFSQEVSHLVVQKR